MTATRMGGGAQKRAEAARKAAVAATAKSRRGAEDDPEESETGGEPKGRDAEEASGDLPSPREAEPSTNTVTLGREVADGLTYQPRPEGSTKQEWLAHITRGITQANQAAERRGAQLQEDYVLSAGRYCHDLIANKLHLVAGYSSVEKYGDAMWGLSKDDIYRLSGAVPVYESLKGLLDRPLDKTQVRELGKAYRGGGKERPEEEKQADVRLLWETSVRAGDTSSRGIARTRQLLALGSMRDLELKEARPVSQPDPSKVVRRVERVLTSDLDAFKQLVDKDPDAAKAHVDKVGEHYQALQEALGK